VHDEIAIAIFEFDEIAIAILHWQGHHKLMWRSVKGLGLSGTGERRI
jgi:hypothetical protein